MRRLLHISLLTLLLAVVLEMTAKAASITSATTGDWSATTTWVGGVVPGASDDVIIANGHTITVDVAAICASLTISGGNNATSVTISGLNSLTVSGAVTVNAPDKNVTNSVAVGAGTFSADSVSINGGTGQKISSLTISTGTATVTGNFAFAGLDKNAQVTFTSSGTLNVGGNFPSGGTLTTVAGSTISFTGSGAKTMGAYTTYDKVAINKTGGGSVSMSDANTTFNGTVDINSGSLIIAFTEKKKIFVGKVTIASGATWDNSINEAITLRGGLENNGTFISGTATYKFDTNNQAVSGANTISINDMSVPAVTVTNNGTITVSTKLTGESGTLVQANGSTLILGGTITINTLTANTNSNLVKYAGSGQAVKGTTYYNLEIASTGGTTTTSGSTVNNDFTITSGTVTIAGIAWTVSGATTIVGTLQFTNNLNAKSFGNVTVNSGGTWEVTASPAEDFTINGNLQNDGTFTASTGTYTLAGSSKTISGDNTVIIPNATVNGTYTNNGTFTVSTALAGSGTLTNGANATLNIGGTVTVTNLTATASPNTVNYNGVGAQTVAAVTYYHLAFSNGGAKSINSTLTVNGDVTINSGAPVTVGGSVTLQVNGNMTNSGTFTPGMATVTFNGTTEQSLGGSTATSFNNVVMNNAAGLVINTSPTINGALTFTSGNITTGANKVTVSSTGSVVRTSGHVIGNLEKYVATGATTRTFEIGDGSNYTPVQISFASVTTAGFLTAYTTAGDHPDIGNSPIEETQSVNRYWTVTNTGVVFTTYDATFIFVPGDIDPGADPNEFIVGKLDGITWTEPTAGTRTATSTQATGMTSFSQFQVGIAAVRTFTSVQTGNWNVASTWDLNRVPKKKDHVIIDVTHTVMLTDARQITNVTINADGTFANGGNTLRVHGHLTINGTWIGSGTISWEMVNGTLAGSGQATGTAVLSVDGNKNVAGTASLTLYQIDITATTDVVTNNGTITLTRLTGGAAGSTWTNAANSSLSVREDLLTTGTLTATANPNTVTYIGTAAQTVKTTTYHHLSFSGGGTKSINASMTANGNVTVNAEASITIDPFVVVQVNGNVTNSGSFTNNGTLNIGN